MSTLLEVLGTALVLSFVLCCTVAGLLQVLAWSRHAREGAPVSFRALRHPEAFFDEIGVRQMLISRRLLTVGGVAYLSYGFLLLATSLLG